jgi:hypothetical protein
MSHRFFLPILGLLALWPATLGAADLARVDRTLKREPAYRSRPKYCLLVFGPQAKTRVWLVLDGDTLYVDRNGNGDLNDPGEKVTREKDSREGLSTFKAGNIRQGQRLHKELTVRVMKLDSLADQNEAVKALLTRDPNARGYYIRVEMELPGWKGRGIGGRVQQHNFLVDAAGVFQFADLPQEAPIIHFGGPWQVSLFGAHRLTTGRGSDVVLGVGTPGLGPGSTAWIDYEGVIPETAFPVVKIVYPPKTAAEAPVHERYELKQRC